MAKPRRIAIPKGKYAGKVEIRDGEVLVPLLKKKKVALLFICINEHYWPYAVQAVRDCKQHFLPNHEVDFFLWSDLNRFYDLKKLQLAALERLPEAKPDQLQYIVNLAVQVFFHYQLYPNTKAIIQALESKGISFKFDQEKGAAWVETKLDQSKPENVDFVIQELSQVIRDIAASAEKDINQLKESVTFIDSDPVQWPIPTLMRYHLFLNEEEKLKGYDYIFYLDSDMRVVKDIDEEIMGPGLTASPHPGYELAKHLLPPYEPNPASKAYIHRLGRVKIEPNGSKRFYPFYAAGGFQGGVGKKFLSAMKVMKKNINDDFDNNYTAIWNDESMWNKYLWEHQKKGGNITFLDVSYIYPDSLIKEYYEPKVWGASFEPKIITLTKPWSVSKQGGSDLQKMLGTP